jgi:uncharacterized membrane protein YphA (DoxX/SURF4 family)
MRRVVPEPLVLPKPSAADIFCLVARLVVGAVLFYAGFIKAVAPSAEFAAAIDAYHLLPFELVNPVAIGLPWIEMWVGTFLIAGFEVRRTSIASTVLFAGFLVFLIWAIAKGIDLSTCGCFGSDAMSPKQTIGMDVVLLGLSIALTALSRPTRAWSLDRWLSHP